MSVTDPDDDRSISRGRQPFSTRRGGFGNIRRPSAASAASVTTDSTRQDSGPDDFSRTRGRELNVSATHQPFSTGRGGVGNTMTSPSRDPQKRSIKEKEIIKKYQNSQVGAPFSIGRGGLGNMISRSRPSDAAVGIIVKKGSVDEEHEPEDDIKKDEYHSIGQGGNISSEKPLELLYAGDGQQSTGPRGVGKIVSETIKNSES